jgi:hypothetical protein
MEETLKMQPEDVILRYDSLCLYHLITVIDSLEKLKSRHVTPADVKQANKALENGIEAYDELISAYESDRLM